MPWPSNKQPTIFNNSLSCFQFLRVWILLEEVIQEFEYSHFFVQRVVDDAWTSFYSIVFQRN